MSFFNRIFGRSARREQQMALPSASASLGTWQQTREAFFMAIALGDLPVITAVANSYPDALAWNHTKKMLSPLVWAMDHHRLDSFTHLLDLGADVNQWVNCPRDGLRAHINFYAMISDKPDFLYILLQRGCTMKSDNYWKTGGWSSKGTDLQSWMTFAMQHNYIKDPSMLDMIRRADKIRKDYQQGRGLPAVVAPAVQIPPPPEEKADKKKDDTKIKKRLRALEDEVAELRERLSALENPPVKKEKLDKPKMDM